MNAIAEAIYSAQAGIQRLAGDGVNVQIELEQILVAFEHRQPDAMARAERLRGRLVEEAAKLLDTADVQQRTIEKGKTYHLRLDATTMMGMTVNIDDGLGRNISRATALSAAASHVADIIEIFKNLRLKDGDLRDEKGLPAPGPTTETLYHLRHMKGGDPVLRLYALHREKPGHGLNEDQVRSAREIEAIQRWAVSGLGLKVQRLPVKIDASDETASSSQRSPAEHQEHMALLHALVYVPWTHGTTAEGLRRKVRGTASEALPTYGEEVAARAATLVMHLVQGDSLKAVARRFQMRSATALSKIQGALDRYAKMRGEFSRQTGPEATASSAMSISARKFGPERAPH